MTFDVTLTLIIMVVVLAIWGGTIWFSINAKPLGNKPYRWATYIGITTGMVAVSFCLTTAQTIVQRSVVGFVFSAVFVASAVAATVGIFRRRKYGVIGFIITYSLVILGPPFLDTYYNRPSSVPPGSSFLVLVVLIITIIYFKRRWKFLGPSALTKTQGQSEPVVKAESAKAGQ